jgi:hypothetical protein
MKKGCPKNLNNLNSVSALQDCLSVWKDTGFTGETFLQSNLFIV